MTEEVFNIIVSKKDKGVRIDKLIADHVEQLSRSRAKSIIEAGHVLKDGQLVDDCAYKVKIDEEFTLTVPEAVESHIQANDQIKLDIVYEDDEFLIVNKQAGLTVHPGAGNYSETMVNALMAYCGDNLSGVGGIARPGIVHRLDKDTSGLILVAKTDIAHNSLSTQIAERSAQRIYQAFCWGVPKPHTGTIEGNIDRNPKHRLKMTIVPQGGKHAITHYEVKKIYGNGIASLVECKLQTGRTHQIRVHFANKGHPLIGDPLYGNKNNNKMSCLGDDLKQFLTNFDRQALHSSQIGVEHPISNAYISISSKLPGDMQQLEQLLSHLK